MMKAIYSVLIVVFFLSQVAFALEADQRPQPSASSDQAEPEGLTHQEISTIPQGGGTLNPFKSVEAAPLAGQEITTQKPSETLEPGAVPAAAPALPADKNVSLNEAEGLAHEGLSTTPQGKGALNPLGAGIIVPAAVSPATLQESSGPGRAGGSVPATAAAASADKGSIKADTDELSHQEISTNLQERDILHPFSSGTAIPVEGQASTTQQPEVSAGPGTTAAPAAAGRENKVLLAQGVEDEISHQALSSALQGNDIFYIVKAAGSIPFYDKHVRDFMQYGASVSFGMGKKIQENLSVSTAIGVMMLTGDWSIGGDRKSIDIAAEEWASGIVNTPPAKDQTITPEAQNQSDVSLGTSYHSEAEATITSAESLKKIDLHTDLYIFPITLNALYRFDKMGKITPYVGGGLGFCAATRSADSRAIKEKHFEGPEYSIDMKRSQTVTGMLFQLLGGVIVPINERLKFVAEADTTLYNLDSFDPVLEISYKTKNPYWYQGSDLSTWSYEDPKHIGYLKKTYVTNISAGIVMPF